MCTSDLVYFMLNKTTEAVYTIVLQLSRNPASSLWSWAVSYTYYLQDFLVVLRIWDKVALFRFETRKCSFVLPRTDWSWKFPKNNRRWLSLSLSLPFTKCLSLAVIHFFCCCCVLTFRRGWYDWNDDKRGKSCTFENVWKGQEEKPEEEGRSK